MDKGRLILALFAILLILLSFALLGSAISNDNKSIVIGRAIIPLEFINNLHPTCQEEMVGRIIYKHC